LPNRQAICPRVRDAVKHNSGYMTDEQIKELLEENKKINQETLELVKYIRRYVVFQQVFGVIKVLLILIPVVLGIIYLPPILDKIFEQYSRVLDLGVSQTAESREIAQWYPGQPR